MGLFTPASNRMEGGNNDGRKLSVQVLLPHCTPSPLLTSQRSLLHTLLWKNKVHQVSEVKPGSRVSVCSMDSAWSHSPRQ